MKGAGGPHIAARQFSNAICQANILCLNSDMSNPGNLARAGSVVALGAMACLVGARAATPLYSISDLGTLGGAQSSANAINNLGQIVGRADLANNNAVLAHAFVYSNGIMTDLSVLGTYNTGQGTTSSSAAYGINNKGEIVGQSSTTNGVLHAFLFSQGQMSDLGVLPGSQQSKAHAINDSSQVVGWTLGPGTQRAFLYENGSLTDLGTLGGTASFAYAINNLGQVAGDSWLNNSSLSDTAFIYSNGMMTALGDLGSYPAIQALAINDAGQVVGYAGAVSTGGPTVTRGFLYRAGSLTDLGDFGGAQTNVVPAAINTYGQIVGTVSAYEKPGRAFTYAGGMITDLNNLIPAASGWTLLDANGINDNGQIVGSGQNASFQTHAYLLTPGIFPQISLTSSNAVQIEFTAPANAGAYIEYSDTVSGGAWQLLAVLDPLSTIHQVIITDPLSPGTSMRFYRVRTR